MGCITLLSDLGLQDASVASVKGILLQHLPQLPIIDISHYVEPYHRQQAAYLISASYIHFPKGTCHIVACDIFAERAPMILFERDGHYIIAPDNGIPALAFGREIADVWKCMEAKDTDNLKDWMHTAAGIAARLQTNPPASLGLEATTLAHAPTNLRPRIEGNTVECHVIHIDRFENVVINITREEFERLGRNRPFNIEFARNEVISELSNSYFDVREGEKLCRFNNAGYLEISINRGKAASLLGLKLSREKHLIYNTIKISFA
jgi:S-adenosyl-L-methionine hydrolase (adenosine-forming)